MNRPSLLSFSILTALSIAFFSACGPTPIPEPLEFTIIQMNDVYEIAPLENGTVGGMARVATLRDSLMKETPVITILSGDFVSPSLIGTLTYEGEKIAGKHMVEVMNSVGVDYVTFGNHEFDIKESELLQRLDESRFLWICSNVKHRVDSVTSDPFTSRGLDVPTILIREIPIDQDTVRLGMTGVVLPFNQQDYVEYSDVETGLSNALTELQPKSDVTIAITHLEMEDDKSMAGKIPGYALFLGGHDHTHMEAEVGQTRITKADANAKTVYVHKVKFDPASGKTDITSTLVPIDESLGFQAKTQAIVDKWDAIADSSMRAMGYDPDEVLMTTTVPLDGRESSIRYKQTNLGSLIAKSMLAALPDQQVGLMNSGSVRLDDQLMGTITQTDVLRTLPFGGKIMTAQIQGDVLLQILKVGTVTNVGLGGYLQYTGIEKDNDTWMFQGEAISTDKTYNVAGTDYFMQGLDANFEFMQQSVSPTAPEQLNDSLRNDIRDAVIAYMKSCCPNS